MRTWTLESLLRRAVFLTTRHSWEARDGQDGGETFAIDDLRPHEPYLVQVFPLAHRPVQQFATLQENTPTNVHLFSPIYPDRAVATFPPYGQLDTALRKTLENSTLELDPDAASLSALPGATPGERLYAGLSGLQKAGLLNVYRKLAATRWAMGWDGSL